MAGGGQFYPCKYCTIVFLLPDRLIEHELSNHLTALQNGEVPDTAESDFQNFQTVSSASTSSSNNIKIKSKADLFKLISENCLKIILRDCQQISTRKTEATDTRDLNKLSSSNHKKLPSSSNGSNGIHKKSTPKPTIVKIKFLPIICDHCDKRFVSRKARNLHKYEEHRNLITPQKKKVEVALEPVIPVSDAEPNLPTEVIGMMNGASQDEASLNEAANYNLKIAQIKLVDFRKRLKIVVEEKEEFLVLDEESP